MSYYRGCCCDCDYTGEEETSCPERADHRHCPHWWNGELREAMNCSDFMVIEFVEPPPRHRITVAEYLAAMAFHRLIPLGLELAQEVLKYADPEAMQKKAQDFLDAFQATLQGEKRGEKP